MVDNGQGAKKKSLINDFHVEKQIQQWNQQLQTHKQT